MRKKSRKTSSLPSAVGIWDKGDPPTAKQRRALSRLIHGESRELGTKAARLVYFVRAENGLIKIGSAFDVVLRLGELRRMSPIKLELLGYVDGEHARKFERALHRHFSGDRTHGEWFRVDFKQLEFACGNAVGVGWKIRLNKPEPK